MNKFHALVLTAALAATSAFADDSKLVGSWASVTANNGALPGVLVLNPDNSMALKPQGQPEFAGKWSVPETGSLLLEIAEAGQSRMKYSVKGTRLFLTYDNGNTQEFKKSTKASPKKGAGAVTASRPSSPLGKEGTQP